MAIGDTTYERPGQRVAHGVIGGLIGGILMGMVSMMLFPLLNVGGFW